MSRLIVKNLPPYITPALLKEHFSQSKGPGGTITDVKVALKQDGTARRFGFVGFKTDEDALKAKEWYDKTFIDSTRVRVEVIDVSFPYDSHRAASQIFTRVFTRSPNPDRTSDRVWMLHPPSGTLALLPTNRRRLSRMPMLLRQQLKGKTQVSKSSWKSCYPRLRRLAQG
jgi:RNA recognition motif-containing protein